MSQALIRIHPRDNVFVALKDLSRDEAVQFENENYILRNNIKPINIVD